jgi:hypothetical protein
LALPSTGRTQDGGTEGAEVTASAPDAGTQAPKQGAQRPRYLPVLEQELTKLGMPYHCKARGTTRARCHWEHRIEAANQTFPVRLVYSDVTDTVYMYVDGFFEAPPDAPHTPKLLRRVMELNWTMLAGKLEWNPADGAIRLSMLMHTDSNFDRRAFRSLVQTLLDEAGKRWRQLDSVAKPDG